MKDTHLTLRIPAALDTALEARAAEEGAPKSRVVREAVVRYLAADLPTQPEPRRVSARRLAARWPDLPHLLPEDAAAFAEDLATAKAALRLPESPWE